MSKHPSLKPKRQSKAKTCLGQRLASERKRRNKQERRVRIIYPESGSDKFTAPDFFILLNFTLPMRGGGLDRGF